MSKPIIEVQRLSKIFKIGSTHGSYLTLRDTMHQWFQASNPNDEKRYVKALEDINFSVETGEKIGIIGKNGAGKSTLLKILSRITPPTSGKAILRGKVASLLEVGTGFHGELTGRENIFLNGAILGMRRHEILRKMDEIIAFSGVERFLDTPLKHYSSGMQVRLAFAVAAHLNPEILLVDEVLSVGDAEFQKKSMEKMNSLGSEQGKTIIFVSHNMAAVKSFCDRAIVLNQGKVELIGNTDDAINFYINEKSDKYSEINKTDAYNYITIKSIFVKARNKPIEEDIDLNDEIEITARVDVREIPSKKFHINYVVNNSLNDALFTNSHWLNDLSLSKGKNKVSCYIPSKFLNIGTYTIHLQIINGFETLMYTPSIIQFTVFEGKKEIGDWMGKEPGYLFWPKLEWEIKTDI